MNCNKCKKEIPDGSAFCNFCGEKQAAPKRGVKRRGNGQGSVFQRDNKTWIAVRTVGFFVDESGKMHRKTVSKSGFKRKVDALNYLAELNNSAVANSVAQAILNTAGISKTTNVPPASPFGSASEPKEQAITFSELYEKWIETHRAGKDTINCYKSAFKYFEPLFETPITQIEIGDLQDCIDACPRGRQTKRNMKTTCGLIFKYGIPRSYFQNNINLAEYLTISGDSGSGGSGIPVSDLPKIREQIYKTKYADYIYCQCYLGFRPSEFLALRISDYDASKEAFCGGAKTAAGKDRIVTISPKIQPFIDALIERRTSPDDYIFGRDDGSALPLPDYRDAMYTVLDAAGIDNPVTKTVTGDRHKYTPHSCRHTFATLLKGINAADKDKMSLIGHASPEMLRYYQDVDLSDRRAITDAL